MGKNLLPAMTTLAAMLASAPAHALSFDFSFTNSTPGGVSGTVTGEIDGLVDNTLSGGDARYRRQLSCRPAIFGKLQPVSPLPVAFSAILLTSVVLLAVDSFLDAETLAFIYLLPVIGTRRLAHDGSVIIKNTTGRPA